MAFTETWDVAKAGFEASPANGDDLLEGAGKIRAFKWAVRERMEIDHSMNADADDGKHKFVTWMEQSTPSTPASGEAIMYPKELASTTGVYLKDDQGVIWPIHAHETYTSGDQTLTAEDGGSVFLSPTAVSVLTLPSGVTVPAGWSVKIHNLAATKTHSLAYNADVAFTVGHKITGADSSATGIAVSGESSTPLLLRSVVGLFQISEIITDEGSGSATTSAGSVSTDITIRSSDTNSDYFLRANEWIELVALQANPTSGAHWRKVGGSTRIIEYSASATFNVPLGIHRIYAELYAGGGGGGGGQSGLGGGGGGGGGGAAEGYFTVVPDTDHVITIGGGGAGGPNEGSGTAGTASTYNDGTDDLYTCAGGGGGFRYPTDRGVGGSGGVAVGGEINTIGQPGGTGQAAGIRGGHGGSTKRGAGGSAAPTTGRSYGGGGGGGYTGGGSAGGAGGCYLEY